MTLNELMTVLDAKQLRVRVPLTPRLTAQVTVNPRQTAELDDLLALYGAWPVFSAEPAEISGQRVMMIDLARDALLGLSKGFAVDGGQ